MERIVCLPDGQRLVMKGEVMPENWDVYLRRVGNGHVEISARNEVFWKEHDVLCPLQEYMDQFDGMELAERQAELEKIRREASQKSAARRAKRNCRLAIKAWGLNELMTLTYRDNQTDRALCKKHFKEWVRRMKRALGCFQYVASFERQKRGAYHVHIATHKLPKTVSHNGVRIKSWQLGTAIWRSIVGRDNGLCFVGGRGGQTKRRCRSIGRIAQYVSKYIMKDYSDAPAESNRYSRSDGFVCPKSTRIQLSGVALADLVGLVFELAPGHQIIGHRLTVSNWTGARYWLCTEPPPD